MTAGSGFTAHRTREEWAGGPVPWQGASDEQRSACLHGMATDVTAEIERHEPPRRSEPGDRRDRTRARRRSHIRRAHAREAGNGEGAVDEVEALFR